MSPAETVCKKILTIYWDERGVDGEDWFTSLLRIASELKPVYADFKRDPSPDDHDEHQNHESSYNQLLAEFVGIIDLNPVGVSCSDDFVLPPKEKALDYVHAAFALLHWASTCSKAVHIMDQCEQGIMQVIS